MCRVECSWCRCHSRCHRRKTALAFDPIPRSALYQHSAACTQKIENAISHAVCCASSRLIRQTSRRHIWDTDGSPNEQCPISGIAKCGSPPKPVACCVSYKTCGGVRSGAWSEYSCCTLGDGRATRREIGVLRVARPNTLIALFMVENLADHFPKYFLFQPSTDCVLGGVWRLD